MSARIEVGSIASKEMGVARVDAAPDRELPCVTLTVSNVARSTVSPMTPALARALAQLLNAAADRAERP